MSLSNNYLLFEKNQGGKAHFHAKYVQIAKN